MAIDRATKASQVLAWTAVALSALVLGATIIAVVDQAPWRLTAIVTSALLAGVWLINRGTIAAAARHARHSKRASKARPLPGPRYAVLVAVATLSVACIAVSAAAIEVVSVTTFAVVVIGGFAAAELRSAGYQPILAEAIDEQGPK